MLKFLNIPITLSNDEQRNNHVPSTFEDERFDTKKILFPAKKVMLKSNLWVTYGLFNGLLGQIITIFYK